jgi:hypothetical protein
MPARVDVSWRTLVRSLRDPGPPPDALPGTAFILLVFSAAAVAVLVWLGHAWHDDTHRFFRERKVGTYLSALNLAATAVISALIARAVRPARFARFWWVAAVGFVWLAADDLLVLHERIDRATHALLGLDPDHPITDRLDDLIVAGYGALALALAWAYRTDLVRLRWMVRILTLAFALFAAMVVVDILHLSKTVEDVLKVLSGTLIVVGFLAACFQIRSGPGRDDLR